MEKIIQKLKDWLRGTSSLLGGVSRSPHWRKVRVEFLKTHPSCAVCGGIKKNEVHHLEMFSTNPSRELDPTNFINLCESGKNGVVCHRFFGHLGNYKKINSSCVEDVKLWNKKIMG